MRHELDLGDWVVTSDNSAAIGEKPADAVFAPDAVTAKFAARVALLEQWAAGSEPEAILLHNFSGEAQWVRYMDGIAELFKELGRAIPQQAGSSETNMATLQSGVAVTMLGKRKGKVEAAEELAWYVYGKPLVGKAVLEQKEQIAELGKIAAAMDLGLVRRVWPVGSKGIKYEVALLFGREAAVFADVDTEASAGPASCVLIGVLGTEREMLERHFGKMLFPLLIEY